MGCSTRDNASFAIPVRTYGTVRTVQYCSRLSPDALAPDPQPCDGNNFFRLHLPLPLLHTRRWRATRPRVMTACLPIGTRQ